MISELHHYLNLVTYNYKIFINSDQQKLTQMNEKMHKKIEELNLKCDQAQIEHEEL